MKVYTKPEIDITELGFISCILDSDTSVIDDPNQPGSGSGIEFGGEGEEPPTNISSIWDD